MARLAPIPGTQEEKYVSFIEDGQILQTEQNRRYSLIVDEENEFLTKEDFTR